jgi:hypothetical protein
MRRALLILAVGCAGALTLVPPASAKWCVRITAIPARPVVGDRVTLQLQTFEPVARNGRVVRGEPVDVGSRQMLYVEPPRGQFVGLDLRPRRDNRSIRQVRFTFPRGGVWELRSLDETPIPAGCRGRLLVRVLPRA